MTPPSKVSSVPQRLMERVHEGYVVDRRLRVLCQHLAELLLPGSSVLDVGCGDGRLACLLTRQRPDLTIRGLDVLARPRTYIPVAQFDGRRIPCEGVSVDTVLLVDVLHHADDPAQLLREAARVARTSVVIKDHTRDGLWAEPTLRFMDLVGNARHGVALPYTYWSTPQWQDAFRSLGLAVRVWKPRLGLYPWPASLVFDRSLHFIVQLERA